MDDSKRLATMKALTDFLSGEITVANEYKHDLTNAVFRGVLRFDDKHPLPMISILENIDPDRFPRRAGGNNEQPLQKEDWIILVTGYVEDDPEYPTDSAYELMADVKKALSKLTIDDDPMTGRQQHPDFMLGGLISGMTMEPGTVRPPQEQVSTKALFWMRLTLKFVEDPNDPYAL